MKEKLLYVLVGVLLIVGLGLIARIFLKDKIAVFRQAATGNQSCVTSTIDERMKDGMLPGVLEKGAKFKVQLGYFDCNSVKRDALVWFRVAKTIQASVKIVKALPGDRFAVEQDSDDETKWYLKINGQFVKVFNGRYYMKSNTAPPLKTYEESRQGKLRSSDYLVLSNKAPGQSDSGIFGLINKRQLEGLVAPNK